MKVKAIHFLNMFSGQPCYEMEDGTLRIPFAKKGVIYFISEAECTRGVGDSKKLLAFRRPYFEAKKAIMEARATVVN